MGARTGHVRTDVTKTRDGILFCTRPLPFRQVYEVPEYRYDDLRPEDRVLDIGANVGAFALRAARVSGHVAAVEPVAAARLRENIRLNGAGGIRVIEAALGNGGVAEICWDECHVRTPVYSLSELVRMAGGCDFLKCDCEGAEWQIDPRDLAGIRRIEMELHIPPISGPPSPQLLDALSDQFAVTIDRNPCHVPLGVMGVLHAVRR